MKKCLKITFAAQASEGFLKTFVQKYARKFGVEGTAQHVSESTYRILVCGEKESVDDFLDQLYKGSSSVSLDDIEAEPFLKDRDFRGVFRVIE